VSWERVLSGPGIEAIYRESLRIYGEKPREADAETIARRAGDRDGCARRRWRRSALWAPMPAIWH
jgi:glucokinase